MTTILLFWRRKWQPTPVFLLGESQGWRSLVGCRLWGRRVGHDWSDLSVAAAAYFSLISIQATWLKCIFLIQVWVESSVCNSILGYANLESPLDCKEIQPVHPKGDQSWVCSLEGLMLKLKLQYFGHLMWRVDSLEKTLMLGGIGGRRRGQQRMRWLDGIPNLMDMSLG